LTEIARTTTGRTPIGTVRDWLTALGVLTADTGSRAEADMKLRAYVPLLQDAFPAAAFTQASLQFVAEQCRYFPTYADVVLHLRTHWRATRPTPVALPPPAPIRQRPPPTPDEIAHVERVTAETVAALRSSAQPVVEYRHPGPRYASPAELDRLNPLPGGRKRDAAT
jgi:hypothetical protein